MRNFDRRWQSFRRSDYIKRILVQGRTFAALSLCSMLFFVAAGLAGMAQREAAASSPASMKGFAANLSSGTFTDMVGMELPAYKPEAGAEGTISSRAAASFMVRVLTDINPQDPRSLLAREMPGLIDNHAVLLRQGSGTEIAVAPEDSRPLQGEAEEPGSGSGTGTGTGNGTGNGNVDQEPPQTEAGPEQVEPKQPDGQKDPAVPTTEGRKVVFIYHSHNRESWFPELKPGTKEPNSGTKNITLVGNRLAESLEKRGVGAAASLTDYLTEIDGYRWELSYRYSKKTVTDAMEQHRDLTFFFDLHRDSQTRKYTTATIDGKDYAQVYFVIGQRNPNWRENEAFATRIHKALEKSYPGISRGIWGKNAKSGNGEYNQSLSSQSILIEIGGVDNTLEESYRTADVLAKVIADLYWEHEKVNGNVNE